MDASCTLYFSCVSYHLCRMNYHFIYINIKSYQRNYHFIPILPTYQLTNHDSLPSVVVVEVLGREVCEVAVKAQDRGTA